MILKEQLKVENNKEEPFFVIFFIYYSNVDGDGNYSNQLIASNLNVFDYTAPAS